MTNIENILKERGDRYGAFTEHARIAQNIKKAMYDSPNWPNLSDDKKQALEVIADKIGRILNGDPEYADSWDDIIGYVTLVKKELGNRWKHAVPKRPIGYPAPDLDLSKVKVGGIVRVD